MMPRLTAFGSVLAVAGAMHATINARLLRRPSTPRRPVPPVSVLIPARDEAASIVECLESVMDQAGVREVLVLDDGSRDGTGELARAAGARVVDGTRRPAGWLGKPWACAQLVEAAEPTSTVLVFLDVDVRLEPGAIRAAVRTLLANGLDLASPFPRQVAVTPAERLVQPLLQWSWLTTLPLRVAERPGHPSLAAATGQFLVVRRSALARAGGFEAVRGAVLDDLALARAVKASGGTASVVDGTTIASARMYDGWESLREGYGKSLWSAFGTRGGAIGVVALLAIVYVLPAVAALRGSRVGVVGYVAGVASRMVAARTTGGRIWPDTLAHPVSVGAFCYLTLRSARERARGRLRWKGRPIT